MSYKAIQKGIERINGTNRWLLALISYRHKSRPMEYTCYNISFEDNNLLRQTIAEMCDVFLNVIDKQDKRIRDYTGENPKNVTDKIIITNELIKTPWNNLINSLNVSDDSTDLDKIRANAYIFVGTYNYNDKDQNVYMLSQSNPIYAYKKGRKKIFESRQNKIREAKEPLVQFKKTFDALIFQGTLYAINTSFESIFNMEFTHRIICNNSLDIVEGASIIEDFNGYKEFALSGQHPRKFATFNKELVDNLKLQKNVDLLVKTLEIPYNARTRKFDLSDTVHAELFTKIICDKIKNNMLTAGMCEVTSFIPLEVS